MQAFRLANRLLPSPAVGIPSPSDTGIPTQLSKEGMCFKHPQYPVASQLEFSSSFCGPSGPRPEKLIQNFGEVAFHAPQFCVRDRHHLGPGVRLPNYPAPY